MYGLVDDDVAARGDKLYPLSNYNTLTIIIIVFLYSLISLRLINKIRYKRDQSSYVEWVIRPRNSRSDYCE